MTTEAADAVDKAIGLPPVQRENILRRITGSGGNRPKDADRPQCKRELAEAAIADLQLQIDRLRAWMNRLNNKQ